MKKLLKRRGYEIKLVNYAMTHGALVAEDGRNGRRTITEDRICRSDVTLYNFDGFIKHLGA